MGRARPDVNNNFSLITVSSGDGVTPIELWANPSTHELLVTATTVSSPQAVRLDDYSTASVTYVGYAAIGTLSSASSWQVKKIDETTGMVITWADGDSNFDNVWDNRVSLSYS